MPLQLEGNWLWAISRHMWAHTVEWQVTLRVASFDFHHGHRVGSLHGPKWFLLRDGNTEEGAGSCLCLVLVKTSEEAS